VLTPEQGSQYYRGKLTRLWKESPMYHAAKRRAWIKTGVSRCEKCGLNMDSRLLDIDHIEPKMAPGQDPLDIALFASRLNCPASGLQALCANCHRPKTGGENKLRKRTIQSRGNTVKSAEGNQ
jgi:hypothetical protein